MEGTIANFVQARHHTKGNQMIVVIDGVESRDKASALVGKKVTFNTGKKDMLGKIASAHGNKGAVRVVFETGMPGQALAQKVQIA